MDADETAARLALFEEVVRVQASDLDIRRSDEINALRVTHPWKVGLPTFIATSALVYAAINHLNTGDDTLLLFLLILAAVIGWSVLAYLVRIALVLVLPSAQTEKMFTRQGESKLTQLRIADFEAAKKNAIRAVEHQYDCPPEWLSEDERERVRRKIEAINRLDLAKELFVSHQSD